MSEQKILVLYTDGSCQPNSRGYAGSGIHGYLCHDPRELPPKQGMGAKQTPTMVGYSVSSLSKEAAEAYAKSTGGMVSKDITEALPVDVIEYVDYWQGWYGDQNTSNIAELRAFKKALEIIIDTTPTKAIVLLDSQYALNGSTSYMEKWKERGWIKSTGQPIENKEDWIEVYSLYHAANEACKDIKYLKVAGHSGELGNHCADVNANRGSILARRYDVSEYLKKTPAKGYWSNKHAYNRFLSKNHWYFNVNGESDTPDFNIVPTIAGDRFAYFMGAHGDDDSLFGKRMSDSSFSVVLLKEREPALDLIYKKQKEISMPGFSPFIFGKLSAILNPRHAEEMLADDGKYLYTRMDDTSRSLLTPDKTKLTEEAVIPYISYAGVEQLLEISMLLQENMGFFETQRQALSTTPVDVTIALTGLKDSLIDIPPVWEGDKTDAPYLQRGHHIATDITDILFEPLLKKDVVHGVKLKKDFTVSTKLINIPIFYNVSGEVTSVKHKLLFDMDLPGRNMLATLSDINTKLYVLTWKDSEHSFRYATILRHGEDFGIWTTAYSNIRFLK